MIRKNCSTYCPPHCEFEPDYCPPIDCPDGIICTELIPSDAIIFEGTYLECFGITAGMNLTDVVLTLAALVFPECNTTTTTSTTTTTTLCQRPTGLTQIILVESFDDGTTIVTFTGSYAEACTASNLIINNPSYFLNTYVGEISSLIPGVTVYDTGFSTDCSVVPDGWYINADDYSQIINIVNGVLTTITGCTLSTTTSTTTTLASSCYSFENSDAILGVSMDYYDDIGVFHQVIVPPLGTVYVCASSIRGIPAEITVAITGACGYGSLCDPTTTSTTSTTTTTTIDPTITTTSTTTTVIPTTTTTTTTIIPTTTSTTSTTTTTTTTIAPAGKIRFQVLNAPGASIGGSNSGAYFTLDPGNTFPVTNGITSIGTLTINHPGSNPFNFTNITSVDPLTRLDYYKNGIIFAGYVIGVYNNQSNWGGFTWLSTDDILFKLHIP